MRRTTKTGAAIIQYRYPTRPPTPTVKSVSVTFISRKSWACRSKRSSAFFALKVHNPINQMNGSQLAASWQITHGHLRAARAMLLPPPHEDPSEGGRVDDSEERMAHNELELALDALAALWRANDRLAPFCKALSAAAENMGLDRYYDPDW